MKHTRLTFAAFVVLMVGLGSSDSLRGIFSPVFSSHFALSATQLGLIVTVSYIGNLVFLLVGGNVIERFEKKKALLALGAAAVLLLAFSTVPGPRADGPHPAKRQSGVLKNRAALPLVFVFGFYFIAEHGVMNWLVAYATAGLGMEQAKASNYLAVFFGGVMLGRLVLSPLVDRLGILKSMGVFGSLSAVLYIAGVVGGAAAMPLWAASGFFLSILYPTLVMSIRLFFPHGQVAGAAGTIISVASLFDILFNVGFGRLVDTLGYGVSIYVLPLAMAAFIITFLAFSRGHGKEQQKN